MPRVSAVILAAGESTRFGQPKQFLDWDGETLIRRAVRVAQEAGCAPLVVVAGAAADRLQTELSTTNTIVAKNPDWPRGLGTSIRCGLRHLPAEKIDAVILLACDQPFASASLLAQLIVQWESSKRPMVASRYANTAGIPALFARSCFAELTALPDDSGAKILLEAHPDDVATIDFADGGFDIDTPADYDRAKARTKF